MISKPYFAFFFQVIYSFILKFTLITISPILLPIKSIKQIFLNLFLKLPKQKHLPKNPISHPIMLVQRSSPAPWHISQNQTHYNQHLNQLGQINGIPQNKLQQFSHMAKIGFFNILIILGLVLLSEGAIFYNYWQPSYYGYRNRYRRFYNFLPYADENLIAQIQRSIAQSQPKLGNTTINQTPPTATASNITKPATDQPKTQPNITATQNESKNQTQSQSQTQNLTQIPIPAPKNKTDLTNQTNPTSLTTKITDITPPSTTPSPQLNLTKLVNEQISLFPKTGSVKITGIEDPFQSIKDNGSQTGDLVQSILTQANREANPGAPTNPTNIKSVIEQRQKSQDLVDATIAKSNTIPVRAQDNTQSAPSTNTQDQAQQPSTLTQSGQSTKESQIESNNTKQTSPQTPTPEDLVKKILEQARLEANPSLKRQPATDSTSSP